SWGAATHTGGRRRVNEDAVLARAPVFVVADGMGGHERGDMASQAVVAEFDALATELNDAQRPAHPHDVSAAIDRARRQITATIADDTGDRVAGSTVAGLVLTHQDGDDYWLVFNVGDSRTYRFADGALEQVSVDHSLVQELVESGTITADEARSHPQRNIITRAVGTGSAPEIDYWMLPVRGQELFLICSDGLAGELSDAQIENLLRTSPHPQQAVHALLSAAIRNGGAGDNVTVVVVAAVSHDGDEEAADTTLPRPARAGG
ncbi:MAG TPA: protein phosphatase 2C domain-containing protein, partial [Actinomycetaceae bacterium]|nr:protein phosphatase 2C domain-containing protein [Actinomycetaceae bacterium]